MPCCSGYKDHEIIFLLTIDLFAEFLKWYIIILMNRLSIISISLGFLILITRGPAVIMPERTLSFLGRFIQSRTKVRTAGVIFFFYALFMILMTQGLNSPVADFFKVIGYFIAFVMVFFLVIFPQVFCFMAGTVINALDSLTTRIIGSIAVIIAVVFLYYGFFVL